VRRCREAQSAWQTPQRQGTPAPGPAFRHRLVDACERICAAAGADVGKSPAEAMAAEVLPVAEACRFLERHAVSLLRLRRLPTRTRPLFLWANATWFTAGRAASSASSAPGITPSCSTASRSCRR